MFDSFFKHEFVQNEKPTASDFYDNARLFHFKSTISNQWYLLRVEEYHHELFAVKFYLKNPRKADDRFRINTEYNESQPIIRICLNAMLDVYQKHPMASFIIVGMNGLNEKSMHKTKRYKLYKKVIYNFFSTVEFEFHEYPNKSTLLMLNRQYQFRQDAMNEVERLLPHVLL